MADWSSWLPDLLPQLPECPAVIAVHEIRRAAQKFFSGSRAWNVTLSAIPVTATTATVAIVPADAEQDLVHVRQVWYDEDKIEATTGDVLASHFGNAWQSHTGTPKAFILDSPGVLRLYPVPEADAISGVVVRIAVTPSDVSAGIPNNLAIAYQDELTMGAKARLMLYSNKPWSNLALGVKHETDFIAAIAAANVAAATSSGQSRVASRPKWC